MVLSLVRSKYGGMFEGYWESRICHSGRLLAGIVIYEVRSRPMNICRHQLQRQRAEDATIVAAINSLILTICANMSASIRPQSANSEDDDVMDDAGGNELSDEDEDQASPEDSSSSTTGQASADTSQGPYTRAII